MLAPALLSDDDKWPFTACMSDGIEVPEPVECVVVGSIPTWLSGKLYRNGPGIYNVGTKERNVSLHHW
ncbi:UNVERIFIED_CONTAM: hypothetical protein HDU68_012364, partial [Siphonaria sp. JEL0065]